jgi:hypothetical protein
VLYEKDMDESYWKVCWAWFIPFIGNRNSKIYHLPDCPDYSKVSERNRVPFKTEAEAQAAGRALDSGGSCSRLLWPETGIPGAEAFLQILI